MQLQVIQQKIFEIRGQKVMLDFDLAALYQVETRILNQAVKRNIERFPEDFMFRLTRKEWNNLRSQFVILSEQINENQVSNSITNCDEFKKKQSNISTLCLHRTRHNNVSKRTKE